MKKLLFLLFRKATRRIAWKRFSMFPAFANFLSMCGAQWPRLRFILLRLFWGCPATISRLIVAIVIWIAVKPQAFFAQAHISKKILKSQPTLANSNAAPTVAMKLWVIRIKTAVFHRLPTAIGRGFSFFPAGMTMRSVKSVMAKDKFERLSTDPPIFCGTPSGYFSPSPTTALAKPRRYFHAFSISYILYIATLFLFAVPCFGQGIRLDQTVTQEGTVAGATNVVLIPSAPIIKFCNFPANAVPCSNLATTFTTNTLGTPCSTSTQIVLTGTTSCVANPDVQGNWGIWAAAGQYAYTVTLAGGVNLGPFNVTMGIPTGTNLSLGSLTTTGPNTFGGGGTTAGAWAHAGSHTFNATMNTQSVLPSAVGLYVLGSGAFPYFATTIGTSGTASTTVTSNASVSRSVVYPDAPGTLSLAVAEYCGATSGATQACAGTVQRVPQIVWGDVLLNGAVSQSITTLPFTDANYSCSGSDLTTPNTGIVSFTNYLAASVTIQETSGNNTDHLRYMCVGH